MKRLNVIMVYNEKKDKILMCKRTKDPYKGLYNLVGGKVEEDNSLEEAYRELLEETNISKDDISLTHFMNFTYHKYGFELEVYYGVLNNDVTLIEEVNELLWMDIDENFFDMSKFAGEGNIGHMVELINREL